MKQGEGTKLAPIPPSLVADGRHLPGTEPSFALGSDVGVLLLHGFTGSPWEVRPLESMFVERGWTVALPALAGHGTSVADLETTTWHDWFASANTAADYLGERCDRVHMVALSMGALLALRLLDTNTRCRWASCTLLAPALTLGPLQERAVAVAERLGWPRRLGKEPPQLAMDLLPPAYWQIPVAQVRSMLELAATIRSAGVASPVPVQVIHGGLDQTIPMRATRTIVRGLLPNAQHHVIRAAGHLLPRTLQAKRVRRLIEEFVDAADAVASARADG